MRIHGTNAGRHRFLAAAMSVLGAVVKVVSKIDPGQQMIAEWRGQPVFIVRCTDETLENLKKIED